MTTATTTAPDMTAPLKLALHLRAVLAELDEPGTDHLAHLAGQAIDAADELITADDWRADELRRDLATLMRRIRALLKDAA